MKKSHKELLTFLTNNKGWQWYGNDRQTKKLVDKLVSRNFCLKQQQLLDNGYIFRQVKLNKGRKKNMSHFYGIISESARKNAPTARAHHSLKVEAQSWKGKIVTILTREKDGDYYEVWRKPHHRFRG
jgi:hypothetical protein